MKNVLVVFSVFFLFACSKAQKDALKETTPKTGIVDYKIQLNTKEEISPSDFGTHAKATFNSSQLHFVKLGGKETGSFQIVDLASGVETNYLEFRGKKYALPTTPDMIPKIGELTIQSEKKKIAGYTCQKATAKMGDGELVAWLTQDLGVNFLPYISSKGFALEYTLQMAFGEVTYSATNVTLQSVNEKLFQPSPDYKPTTMSQLQAELMGQPLSSAFEKGQMLPNFELMDMGGNKVQLKDYLGKVVLINFWFINCPPCRMEMPDLNALKAEYAGKNVEFISITFDRKDKVEEFLTKIPFDFKIFPDARQVIEDYGVMGFPTSVVLDKNGKIVESKMGGSMNIKEELKVFIEEALQ